MRMKIEISRANETLERFDGEIYSENDTIRDVHRYILFAKCAQRLNVK